MRVHRDVDETGGSGLIATSRGGMDAEDERGRGRGLWSTFGAGPQAIRFDVGPLQVHGATSAEPRHHFSRGQYPGASLPEPLEQPAVRAVPLALGREAPLVPGKGGYAAQFLRPLENPLADGQRLLFGAV